MQYIPKSIINAAVHWGSQWGGNSTVPLEGGISYVVVQILFCT